MRFARCFSLYLVVAQLQMKGASLLSPLEERREQIVKYLARFQFSTVSELASHVGYSVPTVKRDLVALEHRGLVRRTRGGAVPVASERVDVPYFMKLASTGIERDKDLLAGVAQHLIHDDMTIVLDSSTTCLHLIKYLARFEGLHVITNGVVTASLLSERTNAEIVILGGAVSPHHQTVNGAKTYNDMLGYSADLAILSCRGFDVRGGASELSEGEAMLKQAIRRQSIEVALLATASKVGKRYMYQSLRCTDIDCLITDADLNDDDHALLEGNNIEVLKAKG